MYVCMYVFMYVCMYVFVRAYTHTFRVERGEASSGSETGWFLTCRPLSGGYGRLPATYRLKWAVASTHSYLSARYLSCSEKRDQMALGLTCEMMTEPLAKRSTWMESASLAIWSEERRANSGMLWRLC